MSSIWCAGCGMHIVEKLFTVIAKEKGFNSSNSILVSGIGCTGRISGYTEFKGVHTTHGRAVSVAEGIKLSISESNVFVISGDGDLLGIGLANLLHALRRKLKIKVLINSNEVFGMTGGQSTVSNRTENGDYLRIEKLVSAYKGIMFARSSVINRESLVKTMNAWFDYDGFAVLDILSICPINRKIHGERKTAYEHISILKNNIEESVDGYSETIFYT